jgi:hypothetical protein
MAHEGLTNPVTPIRRPHGVTAGAGAAREHAYPMQVPRADKQRSRDATRVAGGRPIARRGPAWKGRVHVLRVSGA